GDAGGDRRAARSLRRRGRGRAAALRPRGAGAGVLSPRARAGGGRVVHHAGLSRPALRRRPARQSRHRGQRVSPAVHPVTLEGVRISPIRLFSADGPDEEKIDLILSNLRSRDERRGDLFAQFAADDVAARRLGELVERYGADTLSACFEALHAASESAMRAALRALPDGVWTGEDWLDDDGVDDRPLPIRVR